MRQDTHAPYLSKIIGAGLYSKLDILSAAVARPRSGRTKPIISLFLPPSPPPTSLYLVRVILCVILCVILALLSPRASHGDYAAPLLFYSITYSTPYSHSLLCFPRGAAPPRSSPQKDPQGQGPRKKICENHMVFDDFSMGALALGGLLWGPGGRGPPPSGKTEKTVRVRCALIPLRCLDPLHQINKPKV